jgi:putative FmdB family regulatory protein
MPIFEYSCQDCGHKFEKLIRNSDAEGPACPTCGTKHVAKDLSTFAAHANGANTKPMRMAGGGGCPAGMCRTPDICGRN